MTQEILIKLMIAVVSIGLFIYFKSKIGMIGHNVKENFFTFHGLIISMLWGTLFSGVVCIVIFVNLKVLGNGVEISTPDVQSMDDYINETMEGKK